LLPDSRFPGTGLGLQKFPEEQAHNRSDVSSPKVTALLQ
jgi:hypothetical protein